MHYQIYGRRPTLESFWDEELNLGRLPASADSFAQVEARLHIRLPGWLRQLYRRYDGGAVLMAQAESRIPGRWDTVIPRERLLGSRDFFTLAQVRRREGYPRAAYAGLSEGGDERLVVIAADHWTPKQALCLDYSAADDGDGQEPTIVLLDTGEGRRLRTFATLAEFTEVLASVQYWSPALEARYSGTISWLPEAPCLGTFWSGPGYWSDAGRPATHQDIADAEARLGVTLPVLMKSLYLRQNGGYTQHTLIPIRPLPSDRYSDWCCPLIDSTLFRLQHIVSLAEFASAFQEGSALADAAQLLARTDLIVVLASHNVDCLLCLDYRARGPHLEPEVVYLESWETLRAEFRSASFDAFFAQLRCGDLVL